MSYKKELELRYNDTDQMGVIYHANYFVFFEQSRTEMLRENGIDYYDIERNGFIFPVRDVTCTYLKSIRLGDKVYCETWIENMSKVKIEFRHEIRNHEGELHAKGTSSIICVRKSDFKISKLDKHLKEVYELRHKIERAE